MSNKFKEIDMKNRANYFCDDVVDTKNLDSNKIKINKKSHQIIRNDQRLQLYKS